jgi:hypothetical protein
MMTDGRDTEHVDSVASLRGTLPRHRDLRRRRYPRVVNPAIREHFSDLPVSVAHGSVKSVGELTRMGSGMKDEFFQAMLESVRSGKNPVTDEILLGKLDEYARHRQRVTETLASHLASTQP